MIGTNKFYVDVSGKKIVAEILTCFNIYEDSYCIYTVPNSQNDNYGVYCAKIVGNTLVKIEKEEEKRLTSKVVMKLVSALQKVSY